MAKAQTVEAFGKALGTIRSERKKAENVLLDDFENDIEQKEKFVTEQVSTLTEMTDNKNTLIENKCVLQVSQQIITGAYMEGA
mmetsp:Transcript_7391/g.6655  ORF Transcript_7391/g.6655 Transcript_7391/m.6655 type:complete len:83 (+) Transcript_7391:242-490(+)